MSDGTAPQALDQGAVAIAAAVAAGGSAGAVASAALQRAEALRSLAALVDVDVAGAMASAAALDAHIATGGDVGPLAGVPVTLKDNIAEAGRPLRAGSLMLEGYRSPFDATVSARLRAAGAISVGRTNLDEFGMGSSTETGIAGPCRNPWDPSRTAGGSSGGAAVAVAVGISPVALGTDTGGSVRLPAALCGVVGLKPTYGRVSRHGVVAYASSLEQVGILARSCADAALGLQAISGRCPLDATCADLDPFDAATAGAVDGRVLRVGVPWRVLDGLAGFGGRGGLAPQVRQRFDASLDALRASGVQIVEVDLPLLDAAVPTYYVIATAEASTNLARYDGLRYGHRALAVDGASAFDLAAASRSEGFGLEVQRRILLGAFVLSAGHQDAYYTRACRVRARLHHDVAAALQGCDAIATPTAPTTAWPLGAHVDDPLTLYAMDVFTVLANLAGLPAVSLPMIQTATELPAGLQLMAAPFAEATLLALGRHHEACRGPLPWPPRSRSRAEAP